MFLIPYRVEEGAGRGGGLGVVQPKALFPQICLSKI